MGALKFVHSEINLPKPRNIQRIALREVRQELKRQSRSVLAICPGGGKTVASLYEISEALKCDKRILILSHGTNVLKNQWAEELTKANIQFSMNPKSRESVVLSLPQSMAAILKMDILNFDLVVIDEAHEFYFASMVQEILKKLKFGAKQLLLTGTPSPFVAAGITPVVVSAVQAFDEGLLADTYFGLVKGGYKLTENDYTDENEVKSKFVEKRKDVFSTLDKTFKALIKRLAQNGKGKSLPKTMIAARNIKQAGYIQSWMKTNGHRSILSTSKNDKDSTAIDSFKKDPSITFLIVVRRGILGFNMPDLVNVVDYTGSRNINRIYQLYARVLRLHPGSIQKSFFKICSSAEYSLDSIYMRAALCLCDADFIRTFNGKNLSGMIAPLTKKEIKRHSGSSGSSGAGRLDNDDIDEDVLDEVRKTVFLKRSRTSFESHSITFGQAMAYCRGRSLDPVKEKKEMILVMAKSGQQRPSMTSKDSSIRSLGLATSRYLTKSYTSYDPEFESELKRIAPHWFSAPVDLEALIEWARAGNKRPNHRSTDLNEKRLGTVLNGLLNKSASKQKRALSNELKAIAPQWFGSQSRFKKEQLLNLARKGAPKPKQNSRVHDEARLAAALSSYMRDTSEAYDPKFAKTIKKVANHWFK